MSAEGVADGLDAVVVGEADAEIVGPGEVTDGVGVAVVGGTTAQPASARVLTKAVMVGRRLAKLD